MDTRADDTRRSVVEPARRSRRRHLAARSLNERMGDALSGDESHFVLFYEDEGVLVDSVTRYVTDGLAAGEPVLVVATPEHRRALREALAAAFIDVEGALASGQLAMSDAAEMLGAIMQGGLPDPYRFEEVVGGALARAAARGSSGRVRAYGEMADLLCAAGQGQAALELEKLWAPLARKHPFALLCACEMDRFHGVDGATTYTGVCEAHAHAFPVDGDPENEAHLRMRAIGELRARNRALERELQARAHNDVFRLMLEGVQDHAIFMLDPDGMIATWNVGAERIKGYRSDEVVGRHFSMFYPPEAIAARKCEMQLEIAAGAGRFEEESWRVRKDGTYFWANAALTALRGEGGAILGFAKITRDLTERKRADEERLRLQQSQEANRIKDEFLAVVSHELRTPLNAILGWGQVLESRATDPRSKKAAATIVRNARAQARLIEDVLDVSRIVAGKLRIESAPEDLCAIVADAVEAIRPAAIAKSISLHLDVRCAQAPVHGDATRLQQISWNLLSNAVKFTPVGGSIEVCLLREGAWLRLSVRDDGSGIHPDFLPHVFERFRQGDRPSARASGLGLGLAIVRHLVEMHGGKVVASSAGKGMGSTFTVTLPARASAGSVAVSAETVGSDHGVLDGVSVLVVDDDNDARELLATMMECHGAEVVAAGSAHEARARIEMRLPMVIISDIGMPDESGYQLIRWVRQRASEDGGDIPAVALTAYASAHDRRTAFDAGFNVHVPKPIDAKELVSVVRNLARMPVRPVSGSRPRG